MNMNRAAFGQLTMHIPTKGDILIKVFKSRQPYSFYIGDRWYYKTLK